ncbi:MAG: ABC transporter substrate-binding protein [Streptosporangiaceae bacterium]
MRASIGRSGAALSVFSAVALTGVTACSGTGTSGSPAASAGVTSNASFTLGINADPGALDPQATQLTAVRQLAAFLYDPLVNQDGSEIVSGLASSWTESGNKITFRLRPGVTCSDHTPLTAQDVAANLNYVANPKNASGLIGITIPAGSVATADNASGTVTLTTPTPTGFVLQGVAGIPIVCPGGMANRKLLAQGADGTGPYVLSASAPGEQYTLTRRPGYAWGPGGATTAAKGLPKTVLVKVVTDETTTANLLLSNGLNAATVAGPDAARLRAAGLTEHSVQAMDGEFFYNEAPGRPTASQTTRQGLTQALDLTALRQVATTGGTAPTRLTGESACPQGTVQGNLPARNLSAAKTALAGLAGKTLTLIYPQKLGAQASSAVQLAVAQWKAAGVTVQASGLADAQLLSTAFQKADFDIAWLPVDGQNPLQTQNTFSGPTPAKGGNNFADIDNATYNTLSAQAASQTGVSGCTTWAHADAALVTRSDLVPWAVISYPLWGTSSATFATVYGAVVPTSVRMHG